MPREVCVVDIEGELLKGIETTKAHLMNNEEGGKGGIVMTGVQSNSFAMKLVQVPVHQAGMMYKDEFAKLLIV